MGTSAQVSLDRRGGKGVVGLFCGCTRSLRYKCPGYGIQRMGSIIGYFVLIFGMEGTDCVCFLTVPRDPTTNGQCRSLNRNQQNRQFNISARTPHLPRTPSPLLEPFPVPAAQLPLHTPTTLLLPVPSPLPPPHLQCAPPPAVDWVVLCGAALFCGDVAVPWPLPGWAIRPLVSAAAAVGSGCGPRRGMALWVGVGGAWP